MERLSDGAPLSARGTRRSRWRSYLLLSRISNLPTVWTNVLAGVAASSAVAGWTEVAWLALSVSCFYTGGMFLNDAFDEPFDRQFRPERPIPSGDVTQTEVFATGAILLAAGELMLLANSPAMLAGLLLAVAILVYDYQHKGSGVAPLVMGACRGLVYCVAAAGAGSLTLAAGAGAAIMIVYVAGLTKVAKAAGPNARWLVPVLIAGISLVDAVFILAVSSSIPLALIAATGFALTLFFQRYVPGD